MDCGGGPVSDHRHVAYCSKLFVLLYFPLSLLSTISHRVRERREAEVLDHHGWNDDRRQRPAYRRPNRRPRIEVLEITGRRVTVSDRCPLCSADHLQLVEHEEWRLREPIIVDRLAH